MSTKYQAVADALRAHIQAGKYAGAAVLPSEFAIAEEYQVSRQTVRQALSLLAQDGLIETKRKGEVVLLVRNLQNFTRILHKLSFRFYMNRIPFAIRKFFRGIIVKWIFLDC